MSELPRRWTETTLGDVCSKPQYGWTTKADPDGDGVRLLRTTDITPGVINWSRVPFCTTEPSDPRKYLLAADDIVVSRAGSVGVSMRIGQAPPSVFASYLIRFRAEPGIEPGYVAWYLKCPRYWRQIGASAVGIALFNVNAKKLAAVQLPLPPLAEQRRIVAAIEEHFSRLDAVEESLRRADKRLTTLKLSVLRTAIDGNWPVEPLGELLTSLRNGVFASRPSIDPPGIPIFRISAVRPLSLDVIDFRFADLSPEAAKRYFVQEGDLLFTRYSGNPDYVGACAVVPHLEQPVLHPDKLIRVTVDRSKADPKFLALALSIGRGRRAIEERRKTTAGQVGIAGGQLKTVPVIVPPLPDQRRIVAEVERRLSLVDALAAATTTALKRSVALRRSILERAFTGNLVSQDPTDEPASVLLDRIRAERDATPRSKRSRSAR